MNMKSNLHLLDDMSLRFFGDCNLQFSCNLLNDSDHQLVIIESTMKSTLEHRITISCKNLVFIQDMALSISGVEEYKVSRTAENTKLFQ